MKAIVRLTISKLFVVVLATLLMLSSVQAFAFSISTKYSFKSSTQSSFKVVKSKETPAPIFRLWFDEKDDSSEDECNCSSVEPISNFNIQSWYVIDQDDTRLGCANWNAQFSYLDKAPIWLVFRSIRI